MVREKKRYLLVKGDPQVAVDEIKRLLGELSYQLVGPVVVWREGDLSVIRVRNRGLKLFRAANFLTSNEIVLVSGSLSKLLRRAGAAGGAQGRRGDARNGSYAK